jgi:hypothetical protein
MDYQATWMLLGREMFYRCRSMNAHGTCPVGLLLYVLLIKHSIVVSVKGTAKTLRIAKDYTGGTSGQAIFFVQIRESENSLPITWTLTTVDGKRFLITGTTKHFTAREICQELLNMLCSRLTG